MGGYDILGLLSLLPIIIRSRKQKFEVLLLDVAEEEEDVSDDDDDIH